MTSVDHPLAHLARSSVPAWLVGGALRDRLLGRATSDYDVVVAGDPERVAHAVGSAAGGFAFALSEGFGSWRVVAHSRSWQVDLLALTGGEIEADLGKRDLTVNALAEPLGGGGLVDPFGGLEDLRAAQLRMVSPRVFDQDPLRVLRVARLGCELEFAVDPATAAVARASAPRLAAVAPERVFSELRRIIASPRALDGLELMAGVGATEAVLPELNALRGVQQSHFHHLDVYEHTIAVLGQTIELERTPESYFGADGEAVRELLAAPLANELSRGGALRFGALLHDVAKPATRRVSGGGRVTFLGHDELGAELASSILGRLRAGERLREHVAALTRHHLRLGFLVHEQPLTRHAIYRYLSACAPVQVDVTLLSVADRLATRGARSDEAIASHLKLARALLAEALSWLADPPRPPIRGDELARALRIVPGPEMGRLLRALEEASFAGEIKTAEQAIQRARQLLAGAG
ncbi:MAG: HDIG domain-containing protein [Solirubrobacterales bacterium]|nr:HDIG domain-containing protein [Solirubrobacterales bacterium]